MNSIEESSKLLYGRHLNGRPKGIHGEVRRIGKCNWGLGKNIQKIGEEGCNIFLKGN